MLTTKIGTVIIKGKNRFTEAIMIVLKSFRITSREEDENFFIRFTPQFNIRTTSNAYSSSYPFILFRDRGLPERFDFRDITIFCGGNGSGKSTILNVIAEKLHLGRDTPFNRSPFFDDYVGFCQEFLIGELPKDSRIITSDDVFNRVIDIRRLNDGIDEKRDRLIREYIELQGENVDTNLHGLADLERWERVHSARNRNKTQSQFLRSHLIRNVDEHSNGESALSFFVESIADGGLYLLDEPENSLSASNQLQLKYFLEDCVRNHGCQFVISTHSPFLLSLRNALIYDLDSNPVTTAKWTELESIRVYHDFFAEHGNEF